MDGQTDIFPISVNHTSVCWYSMSICSRLMLCSQLLSVERMEQSLEGTVQSELCLHPVGELCISTDDCCMYSMFCSILFPYGWWLIFRHINAEACSQLAHCITPMEWKKVYVVKWIGVCEIWWPKFTSVLAWVVRWKGRGLRQFYPGPAKLWDL